MSLTAAQAQSAVRASILATPGIGAVTVWPGQVDAARGGVAYIVVTQLNEEALGFPDSALDDGSITETDVVQVRYQITSYGLAAEPVLRAWRTLVRSAANVLGANLRAAGVSPVRVTPLLDVAKLYKSGMEPRLSCDLIAQYVYVVAEDAADGEMEELIINTIGLGQADGMGEAPAIVLPES